jgi:hypothetical protein
MRNGARPSQTISSTDAVRSALTICPGTPNRSRASPARAMLSGVESSQISTSFVDRGRPCAATAWPPTTRYRTPPSANSENREIKSWGISILEDPIGNLDSQ